ncbi:MAG: metalloregulator ArsR/SmtB family transcription factor [Pseudomonadota bacterium]|nr:metalloregulator ArsR/SmtB family transcription factor [Pseudomonadota bacterium]
MSRISREAMLYAEVARLGKAMSSAKRLEMLELLAQCEKSVETLAREVEIDIKLASAHLRVLRESRLVISRRDGRHIRYRLSGDDVAALYVRAREVAQMHLAERGAELDEMVDEASDLTPVSRETLLTRLRRGEVVVIDVRIAEEYDYGHVPQARSAPWREIGDHLGELPRNTEIVVYCRGAFCVLAEQAAAFLRARGFRARTMEGGMSEWLATGLPLNRPRATDPHAAI